MIKRKTAKRPKLTFDVANAAFRTFVPVGDHVFEYTDALREAGFSAFGPYEKFDASFAADEKELAVHRKCILETAKNRIARPWPMHFSVGELKQSYRSPYVKKLTDERDKENGVQVTQMPDQYGSESVWRKEYDPCIRRRQKFWIDEPEEHEKRWGKVHLAGREQLEREATRHTSEFSREILFANLRRTKFYKTIMERDAAPRGFTLDKAKSKSDYPVFSKSIGADWDICWSLEEARQLFWSPSEGRFAPTLHIRKAIYEED